VVEQYDAAPTGELGPRSPLVEGGLTRISREGTAQAADRRWWRVVNPDVLNEDGHEISYQVVHWQGFTLTPRDLTAQRADPPSAREDVNGKPAEVP
jgi:Cu2+-containing amine oxidase